MSNQPRPRVLHVSSPSTWRGGEQQVAYLLEELKHSRWPATLMCREGSPLHMYCLKKGIEVIPFSRRGLNNMLLGKDIYRLCRKRPFDLIHAHDPHAHAGALFAADLGMKVPLIVSRRVDFPVRRSWFSRRKYNHRAIRAIVCVSQAILQVTSPAIRNPHVLRVVHSGIDPRRFQGEVPQGSLRREYGIPADHFLVGNVAALAPHKGYPTFLQAARLLLDHNPRMTFLAIGEGSLRREIEQQIHTLGLEGKVLITGFRNDIAQVLPQLDMMMFPSSSEGLGTTILDAFAAGVPVVTTRTGGIPEMVIHRQSGMLSPVADAPGIAANALEVMNNRALRDTLVEGGRQMLKNFTCTATARKTMALYQEILDKEKMNTE